MKSLIAIMASAAALCAQTGAPVNQTSGFSPNSGVYQYFYGSNGASASQISYICFAPQLTSQATVYTIGATPGITQVVVATNVGTITFSAPAQVWVGQLVTIAASGTTALNGTYKIASVSGSTATIATSGVGDATYNTAGTTLSTFEPVLNAPVWSIQVFVYASGNISGSYFAGSANISVSTQLACSNRANY